MKGDEYWNSIHDVSEAFSTDRRDSQGLAVAVSFSSRSEMRNACCGRSRGGFARGAFRFQRISEDRGDGRVSCFTQDRDGQG